MLLEQLLRDEWGRLLALLVARTQRLDLAEDALAEAFEAAARTWPADGEPDNPQGWLMATAKRRIIDRQRAEAVAARKAPLLAADVEATSDPTAYVGEPDALLRLVLLAAHPALSPEAGAALTLRLVMGVSTADIAKLFLVSETTMAARLTRARKKVVAAGIPFAIPDAPVLPQRLDTVAEVAYLAFTSGYAPGSGPDLVRVELAGTAIRLVRLVRSSSLAAKQHSALTALLALMLLQHSRRDARSADDGTLVRLPEQDRALWRRDEMAEAFALIDAMAPGGVARVSGSLSASYLLQALIAAEHARVERAGDTDWVTIADLYRQLEELTGSPVVRLNRAVAVAEAGDPGAALDLLAGLDEALPRNHRVPAVAADLLLRAGRVEEARQQLLQAISLCDNEVEAVYLRERQEGLDLTR